MIRLKIVTPDGVIFDQENIESLSIPTRNGIIGVYADHMPLFTLLVPGEILVKADKYEVGLAVSTGIVEILPGSEVRVLADTAERAEDIDLKKAEEAREKALEYLNNPDLENEEIDYSKVQAMIEKESARIQVGKKYKKIRQEKIEK